LGEVVLTLLEQSDKVASYVAMAGEPYVAPQRGWLLPVLLDDGDLDWAVFDGELESGRGGFLSPTGPRLGVGAIASADLVLVPALLVDRAGYRLGRGGGSYDRALPRTSGLTVALVHDDELVDELPHEEHDVPVAAVATPVQGVVHLQAE
jgi:5-formyltetrahydrofolate cyclo-ligase